MTAPRLLVAPGDLRAGIQRVAGELSRAYGDGVVLVAVLKGSVPFLADLVRAMTVVPTIDFLAISTYAEGTGRVRLVKDLDTDICDRDVVLVEDIIDTGLTVTYILGELARRGPRSVDVCALFDKPARRIVPVAVRFLGFSVPDEFLVGFGLDFAGRYRNLAGVYAADLSALQADPDAHVNDLYAG